MVWTRGENGCMSTVRLEGRSWRKQVEARNGL